MKMVRLNRAGVWLLSLLTLFSLGSAQAIYDRTTGGYRKERTHAVLLASEPLLPSVATLKVASLGFRSALADWLWIQSIQYFGGGSAYSKYPALQGMLDTITQLDPKFEYPYEFALVVLPFMDGAQKAAYIGERAQQELPGNGLLSYYLASVYHINLKDYHKAAFYYEKASHEPGAPPAAAQLAGVSFSHISDSVNDRLVAIDFWKTVYENATSDDERERARTWFEHMQIVYSLEIMAQQYKQSQGHFPASLDELVRSGYLSAIPKSPVKRIYVLDSETGKVSFDQLEPEQ